MKLFKIWIDQKRDGVRRLINIEKIDQLKIKKIIIIKIND